MKRLAGWLGLLLAVPIGIAASLGALYAVAPVAPRLAVLPLVALAAAVLVAVLVSRLVAPSARLKRWRAGAAAKRGRRELSAPNFLRPLFADSDPCFLSS